MFLIKFLLKKRDLFTLPGLNAQIGARKQYIFRNFFSIIHRHEWKNNNKYFTYSNNWFNKKWTNYYWSYLWLRCANFVL